jgi:hypothetical protein
MERAPIQRVLFTSHPVRPFVDTMLVSLYLFDLSVSNQGSFPH